MQVKGSFGARLRLLRGELNQKELADALGVSRASVGYYENGTRTPDIEFLALVRDYFQVDYEYLLGESEFKTTAARSAFENSITHLSPAKSACIMEFHKHLLECAEAYESRERLDYCRFFEKLTGDLLTLIEAYKAIVYDVSRYDSLTIIKRFLDKITHTNYPEVIHRISQGFTAEGEATDDGKHN